MSSSGPGSADVRWSIVRGDEREGSLWIMMIVVWKKLFQLMASRVGHLVADDGWDRRVVVVK